MMLDQRVIEARYADKWRDESPDYPPCAHCGEQIGNEERDDIDEGELEPMDEGPDSPIRMWRDHPDPARQARGDKQELAFHQECAAPLLGLIPRLGPTPRAEIRERVKAAGNGKLTTAEVEAMIGVVAEEAARRAMLFTVDIRWRGTVEKYFPVAYGNWDERVQTGAHLVAQAIGWSIQELRKEPK
jgi:hypothetical protein